MCMCKEITLMQHLYLLLVEILKLCMFHFVLRQNAVYPNVLSSSLSEKATKPGFSFLC